MPGPSPLQRALIRSCLPGWSKPDILISFTVFAGISVFIGHLYQHHPIKTPPSWLPPFPFQASFPYLPVSVRNHDDGLVESFHFTPPHMYTSTHGAMSCCPSAQLLSLAPCLTLHPNGSHTGGMRARRCNHGDRSLLAHRRSTASDTCSAGVRVRARDYTPIRSRSYHLRNNACQIKIKYFVFVLC